MSTKQQKQLERVRRVIAVLEKKDPVALEQWLADLERLAAQQRRSRSRS